MILEIIVVEILKTLGILTSVKGIVRTLLVWYALKKLATRLLKQRKIENENRPAALTNSLRQYGFKQQFPILLMNYLNLNLDLRNYLRFNRNRLTWRERIEIIYEIVNALQKIHNENLIHGYLHSGNISFNLCIQRFDIGFSDISPLSVSIYGNIPYTAPEAISRREYTSKSDIYSFAILMWEISSGQPPFSDYEHNIDLAMNIVNGMRPKVVPGTPSEYESLMKQCWDADPLRRPDIRMLGYKIN